MPPATGSAHARLLLEIAIVAEHNRGKLHELKVIFDATQRAVQRLCGVEIVKRYGLEISEELAEKSR